MNLVLSDSISFFLNRKENEKKKKRESEKKMSLFDGLPLDIIGIMFQYPGIVEKISFSLKEKHISISDPNSHFWQSLYIENIGEISPVQEKSLMNLYNSNMIIYDNVIHGSSNNSVLLKLLIENNAIKLIKSILGISKDSENYLEVMKMASNFGNTTMMRTILVSLNQLSTEEKEKILNEAMPICGANGQLDIIQEMIKLGATEFSSTAASAMTNDHTDVVIFLIQLMKSLNILSEDMKCILNTYYGAICRKSDFPILTGNGSNGKSMLWNGQIKAMEYPN